MSVDFIDFVDSYVSLNPLEKMVLKQKSKVVEFKKGDIIHSVGSVCDRLYFMLEGYARGFVVDENGKDYTWTLIFNDKNSKVENLFAFDCDSFLQDTPSRIEIEALSDCKVLMFLKSDVLMLFDISKKIDRFARFMTEEAYSYLHNMILDRQTKSAKQRLEEFMQTKSHLLDIVPQYHIASLLDITPQHLSRLKKEINIGE